ncbi:hypothetical protein PIIN_10104 [Serendipita indica DSM 11827]|uniref:DRBM domain-containing protein n=1 Tax=Serendipita indica (strain DSM 11827) TaxID=1109443 RepID=G4TXR1_SERID|nr:hypothetical protein PIIN_10104 [Serendipita indica DSM 11827]
MIFDGFFSYNRQYRGLPRDRGQVNTSHNIRQKSPDIFLPAWYPHMSRQEQRRHRPYFRAGTTTSSNPSDFQQAQQAQRLARPVQGPNYRQLLTQRLQKYSLNANFISRGCGPQNDRRWTGSFWIGATKVGSSEWFPSKRAAKEDAARNALLWMDTYGYP